MRKDQQEELRRLEKALIEADAQEPEDRWEVTGEEADDWLEEIFLDGERDIPDFDSYNTDATDVDMESYSEEVRAAEEKGGCAVGVFLVLIGLLGIAGFWFMKKWGIF